MLILNKENTPKAMIIPPASARTQFFRIKLDKLVANTPIAINRGRVPSPKLSISKPPSIALPVEIAQIRIV